MSYRIAMPVTALRYFPRMGTSFPVCPHCEMLLDREFQFFCDRCGQRLSWKGYPKKAKVLVFPFDKCFNNK